MNSVVPNALYAYRSCTTAEPFITATTFHWSLKEYNQWLAEL